MKRHEQTIGGQLWIQGSRRMTAMNSILDGMSNDRTAEALSGVVEAIEWKHCLEQSDPETFKGPSQRAIVYPASLTSLKAVLESGDASIDAEHSIAYERILG
jgi:hypothetical protein